MEADTIGISQGLTPDRFPSARPRGISFQLLAVLALVILVISQAAARAGAVRPGFDEFTLAADDDGSTGLTPLGFTINFYGNSYSGTYINNNGNITFSSSQSTFTPYPLSTTNNVIIAPFFADVDTRGDGSEQTTYSYGTDTVDGHAAFGVDWVGVGYYYEKTDKLNSFQLILIDRSDTGAGNFDIEFNYDQIQWETGQASGGNDGLGGTSARAGYANGSGETLELPGSGVNGAFLDTNQVTGLIYNNINSAQPGRYVFFVRNGVVSTLPPIVSTGPLQNAVPGETVTLDASHSSDPQNLPLTFQWMQTSGTPVTLSNTTSSITTFVAPSTSGTIGFQVNVSNGQSTSSGAAAVVVSTVATKPATQVTGTSAQLNGSVYAGGIDAQVYFQYGTDTTYGTTTTPQDGGAGTSPADFNTAISGLTTNTTYHFHAVGVNTSGTFYGIDEVFTASDIILPIAITNPATAIDSADATLNASVNPSGQDTTVSFQYGTTTSYGFTVGSQDIGSGTDPVLVAQPLSALTSGTLYHFRVVATNGSGTTYGADQFFTTVGLATPTIGVQQPAGAPLSSDSSTVDFGSVEAGVTKPLTFTVINTGLGPLTNLAVSITGDDASQFNAGAPARTTLAPGGLTTFTVGFAPDTSGTFGATLHVTSNDPATPSFDIALTGSAVAAGFYPVDISSIANDRIERAITIAGLPLGQVTLGGVPFNIPGPLGTLNIWNGDVAAPVKGEATVTVPVNLPDVSEIHLLLNSFWGHTGVHAHVDLIFNAGTFTRNLAGNNDIRDYQNYKFTNNINGVTTVPVFTGLSTLNNVPGRIDKMVIPVPPQYQGAQLLSVRIVDDGAEFFQRVLFVGLTARVGSGIGIEQPEENPLYSGVSSVDFGGANLGTKNAQLVFTVTNNGLATLNNLKVTVTKDPEFTVSPKSLPSLAPGQSATFTVTYSPSAVGPHTGALHVTSTDVAIPSFEIALTGKGVSISALDGPYTGLLSDGVSLITLDLRGGSFSGAVIIDGTIVPFKGKLNGSFNFSGNIGKTKVPLILHLATGGDVSNPASFLFTGSFGEDTLTAYHAAYVKGQAVAEAGTYTILLTSTDTSSSVPQGTGYAILSVSPTGGGARVTGKLADGTAFTTTGVLVANPAGYNQLFLFDSAIYHGKGVLLGTIAFEETIASDCDGALEWIKLPQAKGTYYKAGIDTSLAAAGSLYIAPLPGTAALPITGGVFELSGGSLPSPIQESATILSNNTVTVGNTSGEHVKIKLSPATGLFSGSFTHPLTSKTVTFSGALFQKMPQAAGFFLGPVVTGTGLSGNVTLTPF